jgi:hypothetical protein
VTTPPGVNRMGFFQNTGGRARDTVDKTSRGLIPKDPATPFVAKETAMPLGIPSVALLRDTFRRAVKQALGKCEEIHPNHYRHRCSSLAGAPWAELGPNVQGIQATEAEFLIRGSWQYTLDVRTKDQLQVAQAQIKELSSILASAVPQGASVKGTFHFPPTESSVDGERITCSFQGVVSSQMPRSAAA